MNTIEAKALLTEKLDIYRKQFLGGLIVLSVAILIFLVDLVLDYSMVDPQWASILLLVSIVVLCLGLYLLRNTLPLRLTLRRCLNKLEERGLLEEAATALNTPEEALLGGVCSVAGGYLFSSEKGVILPVSELGWVYFHHMGNRKLDLVAEVNTWGTRYFSLLSLSEKANQTEVNELLQQAEALFPNALIGYSKENKAAWKALCAQRKQGN